MSDSSILPERPRNITGTVFAELTSKFDHTCRHYVLNLVWFGNPAEYRPCFRIGWSLPAMNDNHGQIIMPIHSPKTQIGFQRLRPSLPLWSTLALSIQDWLPAVIQGSLGYYPDCCLPWNTQSGSVPIQSPSPNVVLPLLSHSWVNVYRLSHRMPRHKIRGNLDWLLKFDGSFL